MSIKEKEITIAEVSIKTKAYSDERKVIKITRKPNLNDKNLIDQSNREEQANLVWSAAIYDYNQNYIHVTGSWSDHAEYLADLCKSHSVLIGLKGTWTIGLGAYSYNWGISLNSDSGQYIAPLTYVWNSDAVAAQGTLI